MTLLQWVMPLQFANINNKYKKLQADTGLRPYGLAHRLKTFEQLSAQSVTQCRGTVQEYAARFVVDEKSQRGKDSKLYLLGLITLQEVEVQVYQAPSDHVLATILADLLFLVRQYEREHIRDYKAHLVTQVGLDENRMRLRGVVCGLTQFSRLNKNRESQIC